jgi:peptidoglycan L-alanyl-D-glutamate endopeptidase CwlK
MDKVTLDRIQRLHPIIRDEVSVAYKEINEALSGSVYCRFAYTLRTFKEQDDLYALGRTKAGKIVTNARGGFSYHNFGLALDIVLIRKTTGQALWDISTDFDNDRKSDWMEIVTILKSFGFEWGGDWKFKDYPHFQKTKGYSIRQLLSLYQQNKVDKNNFVLI